MQLKKTKQKTAGIALLVAVSVTLALSIFLVNNFEKNRTNLRLLANEENEFSLNTISTSILKSITLAIKERGANFTFDFISIISSIPDFPISLSENLPNIILYNPSIIPIDHFDYLNGSYTNKDRVAIFNGILNQQLKSADFIKGEAIAISSKNTQFINLLNDWKQKRGNSTFNIGVPIEYKESGFDLNSEFYFLLNQIFKNYNIIPVEDFYQNLPFRVFSSNGVKYTTFSDDQKKLFGKTVPLCQIGKLNLNMLPKTSKADAEAIVENFLEWFSFHSNSNCKKIKNSKDEIFEKLDKQFFKGESTAILLPTDIGNNYFNNSLSTFNIKSTEAKKYFTFRSNLIELNYEVENKNNRIKIFATLYLEYLNSNKTDKPDKVFIVQYSKT